MKNKSWTNGESRNAHSAVAELSVSPTAGQHAPSPGAPPQIDIPPQPLIPAAVAAPKPRRSPANGRSVQNAETAPPRRKAVRARRDSACASRKKSPQRDCTAIADGNGRIAAARESAETASLANCLAVAPELSRPTAEIATDCSAIVRVEAVAASDDAHGNTAAGTEPMSTGCAGQSLSAIRHQRIAPDDCQENRDAFAEVALSRQKEAPMPKATTTQPDENALAVAEKLKVPTDPEALVDGPSYVRAVALHVDLVGASARLVVSHDEKVSKAELDRLRELIFGKGGPPQADEPLRIDWTDVPRPERDRKNLE